MRKKEIEKRLKKTAASCILLIYMRWCMTAYFSTFYRNSSEQLKSIIINYPYPNYDYLLSFSITLYLRTYLLTYLINIRNNKLVWLTILFYILITNMMNSCFCNKVLFLNSNITAYIFKYNFFSLEISLSCHFHKVTFNQHDNHQKSYCYFLWCSVPRWRCNRKIICTLFRRKKKVTLALILI